MNQQRKGRAGELELVRILNSHGIPAEPGQPVSFGATPDVVGVEGIHVEVKRVEKLNVLEEWLELYEIWLLLRDTGT